MRYDLYVGGVIGVGRAPGPRDETRTGWIELAEDLEAVRARMRRVHELGRSAYVVPAHYRVPAVTPEQARERAEEIRERHVARGRRLAPLTGPDDGLLWWEFAAADPDAQARGVIPGAVEVAVDKLDGSIRTEEQFARWLRLSFPEQDEEEEDS
jgi:hypothetical protein